MRDLDIFRHCLDIFPTVLDEKQKQNKARNLIYALSIRGKLIDNQGTIRYSKWVKAK